MHGPYNFDPMKPYERPYTNYSIHEYENTEPNISAPASTEDLSKEQFSFFSFVKNVVSSVLSHFGKRDEDQ